MTSKDIINELLKTGKYNNCQELQEYANLILNNLKHHPKKNKGLQKHHIVPKSVCVELGLSSDYNGHNTVFMDESNHTQAHNLLALASKTMDIARQSRGCGCVKHQTLQKHIKK